MLRLLLPALLSICACNSAIDFRNMDRPADLSDPAVVHGIATHASAAVVDGWIPLAMLPFSGDDSCPRMRDDTDESGVGVVTYRGGCTDESGDRWTGRVSVEQAADGGTMITARDFGTSGTTDCGDETVRDENIANGSFVRTADGSFSVSGTLVQTPDACAQGPEAFELEYEGVRTTAGLSGGGTFASSILGRAQVATVHEVLGRDLCSSEALSGTTSIESDNRVAVLTYDGLTDCDEASTVTWVLDGEPQGEMNGVACNSVNSSAGGLAGLVAGVLLLVAMRRRQRVDGLGHSDGIYR